MKPDCGTTFFLHHVYNIFLKVGSPTFALLACVAKLANEISLFVFLFVVDAPVWTVLSYF